MVELTRPETTLPLSSSQLASVIRRIAGGDSASLASLYDVTSSLLFGFIVRMIQDRAVAEEVLLDVYNQVWRSSSQYDEQRGAPMAWLLTMARTRALDRLRRDRRERELSAPLDQVREEVSPAASPEQESIQSQRRSLVSRALNALPEEQRQVIQLAYYEGLSHSEIALALGQPLGTVKTRIRLAMTHLSDRLGRLVD